MAKKAKSKANKRTAKTESAMADIKAEKQYGVKGLKSKRKGK